MLSNFRIILGTDTVMPSATIVKPLPNAIFALEDDNFKFELDLDNPEMIAGTIPTLVNIEYLPPTSL